MRNLKEGPCRNHIMKRNERVIIQLLKAALAPDTAIAAVNSSSLQSSVTSHGVDWPVGDTLGVLLAEGWTEV